MTKPTWTVPATITRVIDADTLAADLDLGWRVWMRDVHIRLAGLNAPELSTPEGRAARVWVFNRLNGLMPVGDSGPLRVPVTVQSQSLDKYGRVLGVVYLPPGMSLNEELLVNGYAQVMRG